MDALAVTAATSTAGASRESVGKHVVVQVPQPVSVTGKGAAWRSRKSCDAGGQSVEEMLKVLERRGSAKNADVSKRTKVIDPNDVSDAEEVLDPEEVSDGHVSDDNDLQLDTESSKSDVTSKHSNSGSCPAEESCEEDGAADDDGDSAEDDEPEPLPVPSVNKSTKVSEKSSKKSVVKQKAQTGDAGEGSGKVRGRKKAAASAGVTKRVPTEGRSSVVKSGNFYNAEAKAKPPVTRGKKTGKK